MALTYSSQACARAVGTEIYVDGSVGVCVCVCVLFYAVFLSARFTLE